MQVGLNAMKPNAFRRGLVGLREEPLSPTCDAADSPSGRHVLMARRREGRSEANVCEAREEMALAHANG